MAWEYDLETDIRYLQGIEKGEEKKDIEFVKTLLTTTDFDVNRIAKMIKVSTKFVENIKKNLSK
jgi:predicted transcriptional regulator